MEPTLTRSRFAIHAGPCGVKHVADRFRSIDGFGFDVAEGTENVYVSAFLTLAQFTDLTTKLLGWTPLRIERA